MYVTILASGVDFLRGEEYVRGKNRLGYVLPTG